MKLVIRTRKVVTFVYFDTHHARSHFVFTTKYAINRKATTRVRGISYKETPITQRNCCEHKRCGGHRVCTTARADCFSFTKEDNPPRLVLILTLRQQLVRTRSTRECIKIRWREESGHLIPHTRLRVGFETSTTTWNLCSTMLYWLHFRNVGMHVS